MKPMHKPLEQLRSELKDAEHRVKVGGTYAHYKDPSKHYQLSKLAVLEATDEIAVMYEALYAPGIIFVRPLSDWLAQVEHQGRTVPRFKLVQTAKGN